MAGPTRILLVHWGHDAIRGSERVLVDMLARMDRTRFTPTLWCNSGTLASAARAIEVAATFQPMPILLGWDAPRLDVRGYRALIAAGRRLIRATRADVVHVTSGAPCQWMVPAARSERVPLIAHLHAIYGFRERCTLLLQQAPVIVGCSDAVIAPFRRDRVPDSRLRVVPNGVDLDRLEDGDATGLRASLGIPGSATVLVAAGALIELKGFATAIRALRLARDDGLDARLVIAGDGPERGALGRLATELGIAGVVHFLGARQDVGAILRDCGDIAIVPSRIESFALVAAEAGAVGRPTIASRVGGIPEVIEDEVTGLLVPPSDATALARAMLRLGRNSTERVAMGRAAHARVATRFTTAQLTSAVEQLYTELRAVPSSAFGWSRLGFRATPLAKLGWSVLGRRLGLQISDR